MSCLHDIDMEKFGKIWKKFGKIWYLQVSMFKTGSLSLYPDHSQASFYSFSAIYHIDYFLVSYGSCFHIYPDLGLA